MIVFAAGFAAALLYRSYDVKEDVPETSGLPMKVSRYYWPGQFWKDIARKKKWFQQEGLLVELVDTNADYFGSLDQMIAGKMDVNNFALMQLIRANAEGADLVAVIKTDDSSGIEAVVARKGIKDIKGLKGKKVAVAQGSYLEYILSVVLNRNQLTLDDLDRQDISAEKAADLFIQGSVDAIITWEPEVSRAIKNGNGVKLFDTSEIPGISPSLEVFHRKFIQQRPGDVLAYVRVWAKTAWFIKQSPREAFAIIAEIYDKTPEEVQALSQLDKLPDLQDSLSAFYFATGFESLHGAFRMMNKYLIENGITDKQLDSTQFLDMRFLRELRK